MPPKEKVPLEVSEEIVERLTTRVSELEFSLAFEKNAHNKTQEESLAIISELGKKYDALASSEKSKLPTITVDGETYQSKFQNIRLEDGIVKSAEEICADINLATLISQGSGMLKLMRDQSINPSIH